MRYPVQVVNTVTGTALTLNIRLNEDYDYNESPDVCIQRPQEPTRPTVDNVQAKTGLIDAQLQDFPVVLYVDGALLDRPRASDAHMRDIDLERFEQNIQRGTLGLARESRLADDSVPMRRATCL